MWTLMALAAFAQEPLPEVAPRRAEAVALTGEVLAIAGPPAAVLGMVVMLRGTNSHDADDPVLMPLGAVLFLGGAGSALAGPPMLAGGSMRMRRALQEEGEVPASLGGAAWAMWGGHVASGAALVPLGFFGEHVIPLTCISSAAYVGSVVSGAMFRRQVRRATYGASLAGFDEPRLRWTVAPVPGGLQVGHAW